jgi:hypothetical protein
MQRFLKEEAAIESVSQKKTISPFAQTSGPAALVPARRVYLSLFSSDSFHGNIWNRQFLGYTGARITY